MNNMYTKDFYKDKTEDEILKSIHDEGFEPIKFSNAPGFVYPEHTHPETKLLAFLSGSMKLTVSAETFECKSGDKVIIDGNVPHSAIVGEDGCTFFWAERLV